MRFLYKTCTNLHSHQHCLWARHLPHTLGRTWCYPSAEVLLVWCLCVHVCAQSLQSYPTDTTCPPLWGSMDCMQPTSLLCPLYSPGRNTAVGCHALLQGNLPNLGIEPVPLSFQADSLPLIHQGSLTLSFIWNLTREASLYLLFEISFASQVHQNRKEALSSIKYLIRANILSLLNLKGGNKIPSFQVFLKKKK